MTQEQIVDLLKNTRTDTVDNFDKLDTVIKDNQAEQHRLQGEYRLLNKLIELLSDESDKKATSKELEADATQSNK